MPSNRVKLATGLLAATAVLAPAVVVPAQAEAAATPTASIAVTKAKQVKKKKSWAERRKLADRALKIAHKQKGKPYRYGAAGPNAFDCSGFVGYVYKKAGKRLPGRTARSLYSAIGNKVSWKNLAPGDLVFFYGGRSHMGMVSKVKGNKVYMIHSPRTGDVVRVVLMDSYRKRNFNGAVRPY